MRYIIYGAGAIGGSIGARLFLEGHEVILIARGAHFGAIKKDGLRYRNPETDQYLKIPVVEHPKHIQYQPDDAVLLCMKSQHTFNALEDLANHAPPTTPVICCQNGVANEFMAIRKFTNVYAMVVFVGGTHLAAGEVAHFSATPGGVLDAGRFPSGIDPVIETVTQDLRNAGFLADADPRAMRFKYAKLLRNLGNSLQAVGSVGGEGKAIMKSLRDEALACYQAANIECASNDETRDRNSQVMMGNVEGVPRGGGSSWQSLERGTGDIEADYLNGEICYLGRLHNIPTPANEALRVLANNAVRDNAKPGSLSSEEINRAIELAK
ncbi:MAG: hypothetical protein KUG75_01950 [Pseudomonadales bacterium]|nr:hypothetical protein [Pseudomonadales bacterium]